MSYTSFGINDHLTATFTADDLPLTIVAWVYRTAAAWAETGADYIVHFGDDFTDSLNSIGILTTNTAADTVGMIAFDAATSTATNVAFTDGDYDALWVPVVGVFTAANDRDIYVEDSTNTATSAVSRDEGSALDSLKVGGAVGGGNVFNGYIAEVAIFNGAWDTTKINLLQSAAETGPPPWKIDPSNCLAYWSLNSSQATHADEGPNSGPSLAENGVVAYNSNHPTILSVAPIVHHRKMLGIQ